ncbi:MAG: IclR family transcriptional regulator [Planctomycetaceae bacterium]
MNERYLINSILRACSLLKCFSREKPVFKMSELAARLKLDRSTTYRILLTLEKGGMMERDEKTGEYTLGVGALEIGNAYLGQTDLVQIAKPVMASLAAKARETVNLAVLSDGEILYIDKVDSPRSVGVMSKIGQRNPVYCTALGKALLAFQPEGERNRILKAVRFKPLTPNTITSKKALLRELKGICRCGYSLDRREIEEEVECIAAPIRDHLGHAIAAISISGPQKKIRTPEEGEYVADVVEAAASISFKLGFRGEKETSGER